MFILKCHDKLPLFWHMNGNGPLGCTPNLFEMWTINFGHYFINGDELSKRKGFLCGWFCLVGDALFLDGRIYHFPVTLLIINYSQKIIQIIYVYHEMNLVWSKFYYVCRICVAKVLIILKDGVISDKQITLSTNHMYKFVS